METKPLKKKAVALLDYIVTGIEQGKLKHDQNSFHCGSAHCVFGWVSIFRYTTTKMRKAKEYASKTFVDLGDPGPNELKINPRVLARFCEEEMQRMGYPPVSRTEYDYVQTWLGLNDNEAEQLFAPSNSLATLKYLVNRYKDGERFNIHIGWHTPGGSNEPDSDTDRNNVRD